MSGRFAGDTKRKQYQKLFYYGQIFIVVQSCKT